VQDHGLHAFIVQTEGDLSQVVMDARLWQHIVVNLLTNAVKYSPGGGDIHLNVARQGSEVVCRVSDHGIGIPPEALPRLYEPFQRASNVGTINGSGLGLAIVKQSVDRHGGTITCESKLGEGTTFTVRLPEALK
jgi:signal transduction histidine kinase